MRCASCQTLLWEGIASQSTNNSPHSAAAMPSIGPSALPQAVNPIRTCPPARENVTQRCGEIRISLHLHPSNYDRDLNAGVRRLFIRRRGGFESASHCRRPTTIKLITKVFQKVYLTRIHRRCTSASYVHYYNWYQIGCFKSAQGESNEFVPKPMFSKLNTEQNMLREGFQMAA